MKASADTFRESSTYRKAVKECTTLAEIVESLYTFGLNQKKFKVPSGSHWLLGEAVVEFVTRLMEAAREVARENPEESDREHAEAILRKLRKPDKDARLHKSSGFRERLRVWILRELGEKKHGAHLLDPNAIAAPVDAAEALEVSEQDLEEIKEALGPAWARVREGALGGIRGRISKVLRREHILAYIIQSAEQGTVNGVVADQVESTLKSLSSTEIIAYVRRQKKPHGRRAVAPMTGPYVVRDSELRDDIAIVKKALREELHLLRALEQMYRIRFLADYSAKRLKRLIED